MKVTVKNSENVMPARPTAMPSKYDPIIKRINKEIRSIPELDEMMLSDIKSQGVKAMEEYGMRMRVKFMTKPGGQFTLRKLVLTLA